MNRKTSVTLITLTVLLAAGSALAHHSFTRFDRSKTITLTGTLVKLDWRNPHVHISLDVRNDRGEISVWSIEGAHPNELRERTRKLEKSDFQKLMNQTLSTEANPARDGSLFALGKTITFPDGTVARFY